MTRAELLEALTVERAVHRFAVNLTVTGSQAGNSPLTHRTLHRIERFNSPFIHRVQVPRTQVRFARTARSEHAHGERR